MRMLVSERSSRIEVEDADRIEVTVRGTGHGDVNVDLDRRFPLALIPLIVGGTLLLLGFSPDRDGAEGEFR